MNYRRTMSLTWELKGASVGSLAASYIENMHLSVFSICYSCGLSTTYLDTWNFYVCSKPTTSFKIVHLRYCSIILYLCSPTLISSSSQPGLTQYQKNLMNLSCFGKQTFPFNQKEDNNTYVSLKQDLRIRISSKFPNTVIFVFLFIFLTKGPLKQKEVSVSWRYSCLWCVYAEQLPCTICLLK